MSKIIQYASYEKKVDENSDFCEARKPAILKCDCGRELVLRQFTNECDCGADYNMSGQRLAPREQWGEETGEHWSECI